MRSEFQVHKLNEAGMKKATAIAEGFSILVDTLEKMGVSGRELALVKTKCEEACFFAKRSIASQAENQE